MASLRIVDVLVVCDGGGIDVDSTSPLPIAGLMAEMGVNPTGNCDRSRRSTSCKMITSSSLKRRGDFDLSRLLEREDDLALSFKNFGDDKLLELE